MRHKWISPFDLYESLMCRNKPQIRTESPGESGKNDTRLVGEAVGNGTENPAIIATESLIQKELTPEREEKLQAGE